MAKKIEVALARRLSMPDPPTVRFTNDASRDRSFLMDQALPASTGFCYIYRFCMHATIVERLHHEKQQAQHSYARGSNPYRKRQILLGNPLLQRFEVY
ncbi:hypothetical protein [Pseudomonas aeruginosa]|uniref:hypothetical protein n=1 Tax=Pseudomonas aeruginosa TaxID=287 RepID=UPI00104E2286|nr:hypothetical protein [Pseudomonas aeruginosa]EKW7197198.1 hypothetical protein [Pseudomonas aeruginosa]MBF3056482.1 hypothetical protein [Pseudomonas aeruginosa]MCR3825544.1 hypothetical protein [Pseudomonas aeruginosa]TQH89341.1 hypothetical protein FLI92_28705 [Pseudomonas aeruginosa]HCE7255641.1 hypothetical protein [Pseudomonas aeruginosa]